MAGTEDTELRDLVVEALEKNGSLAKIRALLRANIFLAFESEREPARHNSALDRLLATPEGAITLGLVAEFLDACELANTAFVYRAESRQGRAYRYDGRKTLVDRLGGDYVTKSEPLLVSLLKQVLGHRKTKHHESRVAETNPHESPKNEVLRKEDDNCTYIVHDESGSTRSDNSSDDKNKLLLRLPLDNSDTDTSSDSIRDKTRSEYIPNKNIQIDADSEEDSKNSNYMHKYYKDSVTLDKPETQNKPHEGLGRGNHTTNERTNIANSSDSTSYLEITTQPRLSNGNVDPNDRSPNVNSVQEISGITELTSGSVQKISEPNKLKTTDSQSQSAGSYTLKHESIVSSKPSMNNSPELPASSKTIDLSSKSEMNYSDDFSPTLESRKTLIKQQDKNISPRSTDSGSIQEDISLDCSEKTSSMNSPRQRTHGSSHSSVSLSDVAELIENSAKGSPPNGRTQNLPHKSVIVMNSNLEEVSQRLNSLFKNKNDGPRMSSTKNTSGEISELPVHSLSNISILDVHSD